MWYTAALMIKEVTGEVYNSAEVDVLQAGLGKGLPERQDQSDPENGSYSRGVEVMSCYYY